MQRGWPPVIGGKVEKGKIRAMYERWDLREIYEGGLFIGVDGVDQHNTQGDLKDYVTLLPTPLDLSN